MRHSLSSSDQEGAQPVSHPDTKDLVTALTDPNWRKHCLAGRHTFSSITTYLAQLLAHDVVRTAPVNTPFDSSLAHRGKTPRTDLRRGTLLLDTIYGDGMHIDHRLFMNKTGATEANSEKFRLLELQAKRNDRRFFCPQFETIVRETNFNTKLQPIIADRRNQDNVILLLMTAVFKAYHNKIAAASKRTTPEERFVVARIQTIRAWHNIIRADILDRTTLYRSGAKLKRIKNRGDAVHAALRCFHTLVLPRYAFRNDRSHRLAPLLGKDAVSPDFVPQTSRPLKHVGLQRWAKTWGIDWHHFSTTNKTCFAPILSRGFKPDNIFELDVLAGQTLGVSSTSTYPDLRGDVVTMLDDMKRVTKGLVNPGPEFVANVPLSMAFLAEAYMHNHRTGTLGPIGSHLVRTMIEAEIGKSRKHLATMFPAEWARLERTWAPENFAGLNNFVNSKVPHRGNLNA